jgi:hypothetical protein
MLPREKCCHRAIEVAQRLLLLARGPLCQPVELLSSFCKLFHPLGRPRRRTPRTTPIELFERQIPNKPRVPAVPLQHELGLIRRGIQPIPVCH